MKTKTLVTSVLLSAALVTTLSARAETWEWSVSGTGLTGSGEFTTAGSATAPELITSWSGTWAGQNIVNLAPVNPPGYSADNLFQNSGTYFTNNGVVFNVGGLINDVVNIYSSFADQLYAFSYTDQPLGSNNGWFSGTPGTGGGYGIPVTFSVSAVPEPEIYAMMMVGLGLLGFTARRRKQQLAA